MSQAVRVWDPRSGTKTMKLKGHTDNIRALALDDGGRYRGLENELQLSPNKRGGVCILNYVMLAVVTGFL